MDRDDTDLFIGENEKGSNKDKIEKWFLKNWKIIAAFIVVVVIGGSVYSYSQKTVIEQSKTSQSENQETAAKVNKGKSDEEITNEEKNSVEKSVESPIAQTKNEKIDIETSADESNAEEKSKNNKEFTEETFTEKAEQGEGITHLARKALKNYLAKEGNGLELSKEQKIYIEDYLQNETGSELLAIGEERAFSKNMIEEAVESAQKLSDEQLKKIEQFSALAPSLI